MYAQRDRDEKAEQTAKEQLETEKPRDKKVAEEPPRKREGFRNFYHLLLRRRKALKKESGLQIHIHLAQSLLRVQFPHAYQRLGNVHTLLSEKDAFDAQQHEALQIHFVAGNH